jgi:hypothetical protein
VIARLVPLTPPRKIVHGLGNILSQVEQNGRPVPASVELEALIPFLLQLPRDLQAFRKLRDGAHDADHQAGGPVGVWAMTIPPQFDEKLLLTDTLDLTSYHRVKEYHLIEATANRMDALIAGGCQLHKVCE